METDEIRILSGVYLKTMQKLAAAKLLESPSVNDLMDNKSLMQRAYKEMKQIEFGGGLIDYICSISTAFVINTLKPFMKPDANLTEWALAFIDNYERFPEDIRNVIRFWHSYEYSVEFMLSEIQGTAQDHSPEAFYFDLEQMDDFLVMSGTLCQFMELLIEQDLTGKRSEFYDTLIERIKARARKN